MIQKTRKIAYAALFTILVFALLGWAESSWAACVGPAQSEVVSAVAAASPGDTVEVCAGSATWTATEACPTVVGDVNSMLCIRKGIVLKGGIDGTTTIITLSGSAARGAIRFALDADSVSRNDPVEFTGFEINSDNEAYAEGSLMIDTYPPAATIISNVKIHDNVFRNSTGTAMMVSGPVYGVAYRNTFINCGGYMNRWMGGDSASWDIVPREYGGSAAFFFEDNTIRFEPGYTGEKSAFMTGQGAPGLVMRYNAFDLTNSDNGGELGDIHGLQSMAVTPGYTCPSGCGYSDCLPASAGSCDETQASCSQWSTIKTELYGNIWSNLSNGLYLWIVHRGSWLMMFNNRVSGTGTASNPQYSQYSCDECISEAGNPSMHIQNTYVWNNFGNDVNQSMTKRLDYCADASIAGPYIITENVDYWNFNTSTLDGSTQRGINCGSAEPASSCSTGDGYWRTAASPCSTPPSTMADMKAYTQAGTFYKCTAPGTWTQYYAPYTYPHPLRNEGDNIPPAAPSHLSVT